MSTQTSPIKTTREDRRVVRIPDAGPPRRWGLIVAVTLTVLAALVLGAFAGSVSQRSALRDRDARIASAQAAATQAAAATNQALAQASSAAALADDLRAQLGQKQEALALLRARGHESAAQVRTMRARVADIRAQISEVQRQSTLLTGSPLRDGRYAVRLVAVGAAQSPVRLVFDLGTWLSGAAARKAAIADGVIPAHARLPHNRYFRNRVVHWRVMPVASDARVSIRTRHGHPVFDSNLTQLQDVIGGRDPGANALLRDPFWIIVRDGNVVSVRRQAYP
jgi:hypothetical protein